MALKPCRECGKEISTEAKSCPHCGKSNPTGPKASAAGIGCLMIIVLIVIGSIVSSNSGSDSPASSPSGEVTLQQRAVAGNVNAMELWRAYDANEVAADNYYKGRVWRVTGAVQSIDKDIMDNIVLHLVSPNEFMSTSATVDRSGAAHAAQLSKGERVTLTCVVRGRFIGSPNLDDCTF